MLVVLLLVAIVVVVVVVFMITRVIKPLPLFFSSFKTSVNLADPLWLSLLIQRKYSVGKWHYTYMHRIIHTQI